MEIFYLEKRSEKYLTIIHFKETCNISWYETLLFWRNYEWNVCVPLTNILFQGLCFWLNFLLKS